MTCEWLITNNDNVERTGLGLFFKSKRFKVYHKGEGIISYESNSDKMSIIIDGYVLPRIDYANEFAGYTPASLIKELYLRYQLGLINYIKGNFVLIILKNDGFYIFNDRIGIRKFFYFIKGKSFIFSNRIKSLTGNINRKIDYESLAIYSLTNQFIDGMTFLKEVLYSKPSSKICFTGQISFDSYWNCEELLNQKIEKISYEIFSEKFTEIINSYVDYLKPGKISLTLTGGLDSRAILAALLHLGVKPVTFTYGHPSSEDVITAKKIARTFSLDHKNYYVKPSAEWFSDLADDIIDKGNSIIHIHRAHRLFSVSASNSIAPNGEILFGGHMGGELIRNFFYDGIITTDFTANWLNDKSRGIGLVKSHLERNFVRVDKINLEKVTGILLKQRFSGNNPLKNEFFFTFLVNAAAYLAQDMNLWADYKKYSIPVYLDIDLLHLIFASKYNFMYSKTQFTGLFSRLNSHKLYCHLIHRLFPRLANIPLAKRGYFTPAEMVKNNRMVFIAKRLLRLFLAKQQYPANFPLGEWLNEYAGIRLKALCDSELITDFICVKDLLELFATNNHQNNEKYWRKFTNPIFFSRLFDFYLKP
jgi:hypothetical protein